MSSVDDRIVNMQFNNKQFTQGVTQSQRSLDGLEKTLSNTAKGKGLATMGANIDGIKHKFSVMQIAGVTALATITNKAVNAGLAFVKSFTLGPVIDGFHEYQTNLNSIQTVMANTGKGIKPVNAALNQLNHYADKTIYNFSQMAHNVGTFTAAGVGLKTSVAAIQGISNIAALSGSSAQQASTAMYQLSQSISAGRVNLQDWNSVVNAGMGGKNLQKALIQTGEAMGTIDSKSVSMGKNIKVAGESFRQSISATGKGGQSWLTSDVLVKTLSLMDGRLSKAALSAKGLTDPQIAKELDKQEKLMAKQGYTPEQIQSLEKMADASFQSATVIKTLPQLLGVVKEALGSVWSNAFSQILGNFNQSKKLWTSVGNSLTNQIMSLNHAILSVIGGWKSVGGRSGAIQAFANAAHILGGVLGAVKGAFQDVFPSTGNFGETLGHLTHSVKYFLAALVPSAATVKSLRSIFGGFFAVLHIGISIIGAIAKGFGAFFGAIFSGSGDATGGILSILASIGELLKGFDKWLTAGGKLSVFMTTLGATAGAFVKPFVEGVGLVIQAFASLVSGGVSVNRFFSILINAFPSLTGAFVAVKNVVNDLMAKFGGLSGIGAKIVSVFKGIGSAISGISAGGLSGLFSSLGSEAGKGAGIAANIVSGLAKGIANAAPQIMAAVASLGRSIIEGIKGVLGIHSPASTMIPVGKNIVAGIAQGIIAGIKALPAALAGIAGAISDMFKQLFGGFNALDFASFMNAILTGGLLLSLKRFSDTTVSFKKILLQLKSSVIDTFGAIQSQLKAKALEAIAVAIALLTASLIALSFIKFKDLAKGLGAISIMFGLLAAMMSIMMKTGATLDENGKMIFAFNKNVYSIAGAMVAMSVAILILAAAVKVFGGMDWKTLLKGLGAVAIAMGIMVAATKSMNGMEGEFASAGAGMVLMATGMLILAKAVGVMGGLSLWTIAKGLGAIAIGVGLLSGELAALGAEGPAVMAGGAALLLAATGMLVLSAAVAAFGNMDMKTLIKSFIGMGLGLLILTASLAALGAVGPAVLAGGAALVLAAVAMNILAVALLAFLPVILAFNAVSWGTIVGGAAKIAAAILIVGVAALVAAPGLVLLGAAMVLAGVGMLAFATGFATLAAAGTAGVAVLTAAVTAVAVLLPAIAQQVAAAFVSFIETIAKAAPRIRAAVVTIVSNMIQAVQQLVPKFGSLMATMINTGLNIIKKTVPKFISVAFTIISAFLKSLDAHIGGITKTAANIAIKFMNALGNQAGPLANAAAKMIIKFINALSKAVDTHSDDMGKAGGKLAVSLVKGLVSGLGNAVAEVGRAAEKLAHAAVDKIHDIIKNPPFPSRVGMDLGYSLGIGLARGIDNGQAPTVDSAGRLATGVIDTFTGALRIASPSKVAYAWGQMIGAGLSNGIYGSIKNAVGAAVVLANSVISAGSKVVTGLEGTAQSKQSAAYKAQAIADSEALAVSKMAGKTKAQKKAKAAAQKRADAAAKVATAKQAAADAAVTAVQNRKDFEAADSQGQGDILKANALAAADTANKLLSRASAEAAEAKKFARTNRAAAAALLAKSKADAIAAGKYAKSASANQAAALVAYGQTITDRIKLMEDAAAAEAKAAADQATYDAADNQGKIAIMNARAASDDAAAAKAKADSLALIAQAKKLAGTDSVKAAALLDQADILIQQAKDDAAQAASERDTVSQLTGQTTDTTSATGTTSVTTPTADVLAQAASAVDRWTTSLIEAQEAAQATPQPITYEQNITSPVALTPSEIYRQSKNLLAMANAQNGTP